MYEQNKEEEFKKRYDWSLWKNLFVHARPHRRKMMYLAGIMILTAAVDAALPLMTKHAIDKMILPKSFDGIYSFAMIYIGLVVFQFLNIFLLIDVAGRIETGMNYDLRRTCYHKLQQMSFSYYDRTPTGWLVARLTSDISRLGDVFAWGIVDLIWGFAVILLVSVIIFMLNWKLALIIMALIPIMVFVAIKFQILILRSYRQVRKLNSQITNSFGECIHGAKTTKTLVREEANMDEFCQLSKQMYKNSVQAAIRSALFMPIILAISALGTGMIVWIGGSMVLARIIGYGTLMAFIGYAMQIFEPISNVAHHFAEMQNAQAAGERVFSLLKLKPEIISEVELSDEWKSRKMMASIKLDDVSFAYKEGKNIFSSFNLEISSGECLALVGETGTGKTTLVNLICRFYQPSSGRILIDGFDYTEIPLKWIHSQLGYVQQVPHLFQGSIKENIRYGKLDASDEEVYRAAETVNADDFILNLPGKYDYQVGESGNLLSTGQKQLISFARVVLANPTLLILDEATASIDTETEKVLQDAIRLVLKGRTSIIIAHRLSTIREADRILLMHKGLIVEQGSHHELMKKRARYYDLYMNQFMQEITDQELAKDA